MSTDTDRLEREAEQHRSSVDSTIDQLRDRFSVGQIVDELSTYAREGQGADMARNLGRQVRDNPLALGLVGAGIAWLLMGDTARDQGYRLKSRYGDWRDDDDDRFERAFPAGSADRRYSDYRDNIASDLPASGRGGGRPAPYPLYGEGGEGRVGHTGPSSSGSSSQGPGMADRARGAASSVGSGISGAASSVGSSASHAGQAAADAARRAGSGVSSMGHDAADAAYRAGDAAYRGAAYAGRGAYSAGRRAQRTFLDTLQEEPLVMGAVALAIGAAVGAALPATRREDEWLGEARDRLRDDAYDYGRDTLHRAEHVAEEAFKAGSEEAERKGLKPTGEGETIAEKVSSVARTATEAAKSDAKKEGLI